MIAAFGAAAPRPVEIAGTILFICTSVRVRSGNGRLQDITRTNPKLVGESGVRMKVLSGVARNCCL